MYKMLSLDGGGTSCIFLLFFKIRNKFKKVNTYKDFNFKGFFENVSITEYKNPFME